MPVYIKQEFYRGDYEMWESRALLSEDALASLKSFHRLAKKPNLSKVIFTRRDVVNQL